MLCRPSSRTLRNHLRKGREGNLRLRMIIQKVLLPALPHSVKFWFFSPCGRQFLRWLPIIPTSLCSCPWIIHPHGVWFRPSDLLLTNRKQQTCLDVTLEIRCKKDSAFWFAHLSSSLLACCDKTSYVLSAARWRGPCSKGQREASGWQPEQNLGFQSTNSQGLHPANGIYELGRLSLSLGFK